MIQPVARFLTEKLGIVRSTCAVKGVPDGRVGSVQATGLKPIITLFSKRSRKFLTTSAFLGRDAAADLWRIVVAEEVLTGRAAKQKGPDRIGQGLFVAIRREMVGDTRIELVTPSV